MSTSMSKAEWAAWVEARSGFTVGDTVVFRDEDETYTGRILHFVDKGGEIVALVRWFDGARDSRITLQHLAHQYT